MFANGPISERRFTALDRYLTGAAREMLTRDERLRGTAIEARFDRGVAHLTGEVADPARLRLARDLLGRLDGVLAVWSRVRVAGRVPVMVDVGCGGTTQYPGSIGLDVRPSPVVAVRADLSRGLPLADRSADVIFAVHILEHLVDFLPLVDECHRVLRPGGVLHVLSPWWRFVNAVADPTHVRLIDIQTIKAICTRSVDAPRWYPLHAGCDGASVFADLTPLADGHAGPDEGHLARFFD